MKFALSLIGCLVLSFTAQANQFPEIPIGLKCTVASMIHSNDLADFPTASTKPENIAYMNRCISTVQIYARAHCPQSKHTIWQQIEAVAYSGPGIPDKKAIAAACR